MNTEAVARALAAIGNPVRLRLLLELASCCSPSDDAGDCCGGERACCAPTDAEGSCVGRIAEAVRVAPSTVSHHIKELRDAGVIWCHKKGRRVCCGIDPETLAAVRQIVERLHAVSEPRPRVGASGSQYVSGPPIRRSSAKANPTRRRKRPAPATKARTARN